LLADPTLAARLGSAARERARERYDAAVRARRFEDFYDRLVRPQRAA
jgi:glycosyltransferase involved in cell wall biosynthesis